MEKDFIIELVKKIKEFTFVHWKATIFALIAMIFVNLLYVQKSIVRNTAKILEVPVFRTYKTTGNTFYKKQDTKKWLFLSGEEILSTGSELQTDANSHAILSFVGQSGRVELSDKTHVGIIKNGNDITIDFKKGEVYINYQAGSVQKPLLVKLNQKVFRMTNADLFIRGDSEDQVQISVEYGRTTMLLGKQVTTLEKGQSVFYKNDKDYAVEESKFNFSTPFNYDRYNLEKEEFPVRFAFAQLPESYQYQLYAGQKIEALEPIFQHPQTVANGELTAPFKKGSYYWQLAAIENGKPVFYSHLKRFFVEHQAPIQLVKPSQNSKFQLVGSKASVQFQWDNPSQLEKAFIEISTSKEFSKTLVNESVSEMNYFNYDFEGVGEYYWRVSGFPFGTTDLLSSLSGKISVVNDVVSQQVKLLFPKNKVVLTTLSLKNSDITFQWTKNSVTTLYKVEITSLFTGKITNVETKETQVKIKDLPPGKYTWKVSDKNSNLVSEKEEFNVVQTRRLNFAKESGDFGFLSWQEGPRGTSKYRVEVLRIGSRSDFNAFFDDNSATKKTLEIKGDKISYKNFSDGIYAFKVYALDSERNILADSNLKFLKVGNPKK